jgi:hypothetical protein
VKDSSYQTYLSLKDIQELERCRKKMDSKDELLRDLFVSKVTDSDRSTQQCTGLPSKPVFEGVIDVLNLFILSRLSHSKLFPCCFGILSLPFI